MFTSSRLVELGLLLEARCALFKRLIDIAYIFSVDAIRLHELVLAEFKFDQKIAAALFTGLAAASFWRGVQILSFKLVLVGQIFVITLEVSDIDVIANR